MFTTPRTRHTERHPTANIPPSLVIPFTCGPGRHTHRSKPYPHVPAFPTLPQTNIRAALCAPRGCYASSRFVFQTLASGNRGRVSGRYVGTVTVPASLANANECFDLEISAFSRTFARYLRCLIDTLSRSSPVIYDGDEQK